MKIISAVDIMGGSVVRLVKGEADSKVIYSNDPLEIAKKWEAAGADMLHVVDLDAVLSIGSNSELVSKIAAAVQIPVQVSGGIRTIEAVDDMLAKATRVVIGTMAYNEPEAVKKLAKKYANRIVVSIDQKNGVVMMKGWKESTGTKVTDAISQFKAIGIHEFLLTSIERDGTLEGPDMQILAEAADSGSKIIASGGIARVEDIVKVRNVGCSAVILGKAMYDGKISIEKAKAMA
jgi:phosphoribosylformimino-5-aminoimidazole carboxamide ribotide isomerase